MPLSRRQGAPDGVADLGAGIILSTGDGNLAYNNLVWANGFGSDGDGGGITGTPRPQGAAYDVGAFQWVP